jgi:tRNA-dihydrouridine synthase A
MLEISLAPMLKVTTPQFRAFIRETSKSTVLFTEMIVASTIIHVPEDKLKVMLGPPEDLTTVQIGGSDPLKVAQAVGILKKMGWKSFNLNCGCPSDRVQSGMFGAILMLHKETVANIINEVHNQTGLIISLKIRTGVDENDSYEFFRDFIEYISNQTPCHKFYVHARKCWLKGVSPKQNRNIPALNYDFVYRIKDEFPNLFISLNGGIKSNDLDKVKNLDGLMIGREAWENIWIFSEYDGGHIDKKTIIKSYLENISSSNPPRHKALSLLNNLRKGKSLNKVYKHTLNDIIHSQMPFDRIFEAIEAFIE